MSHNSYLWVSLRVVSYPHLVGRAWRHFLTCPATERRKTPTSAAQLGDCSGTTTRRLRAAPGRLGTAPAWRLWPCGVPQARGSLHWGPFKFRSALPNRAHEVVLGQNGNEMDLVFKSLHLPPPTAAYSALLCILERFTARGGEVEALEESMPEGPRHSTA